MSNLQLYIAIGLPIIAVLTSLTISLIQISAVPDDVRAIREEMRGNMQTTREETRTNMQAIREIRADIKLLTGKVYELMGQK
jgi:uncharacterized membrane protein (DUF106 family)